MRPIDADAYGEKLYKMMPEIDEKNGETCMRRQMTYFCLAVLNDIPTIAPPPNNPLTLEELREMDGEPVWVVEFNGYPPRWGLVYWCKKNKRDIVYITINNGVSIDAKTFMAAGGQIYRRKPEEGTT